MKVIGIISFLLGAVTTFCGYAPSYEAQYATTGGWVGSRERYIDYEQLHIANIVTFIGVALIVVGIIFFFIIFINKVKKKNAMNTIKCLNCSCVANKKQHFCSKCGNNLH